MNGCPDSCICITAGACVYLEDCVGRKEAKARHDSIQVLKSRYVELKNQRTVKQMFLDELYTPETLPQYEFDYMFNLIVTICELEKRIKNEEAQEKNHVCGCDNAAAGEIPLNTARKENGSRHDVAVVGQGDTAPHAWRVSGCYEEDGEGLESTAVVLPC